MLISVVLPCYNEEKVLSLTYGELSAALNEITDDYEMIFVDDGSTYKRRGHPLVVIVRNGYGRT